MSNDWVLRDVAKYRQFLKNMDTQDKKDYDKIQGYRRAAKEQSIKDMKSHKTVDKMHGTSKTTLKDIFNNLLRVVTKVLEWQGNGSPGDNRVFQYCRLLKMEIEGRGALKKKKKKTHKKKKKKTKKKTKKKN
jgi:hypothetical protein